MSDPRESEIKSGVREAFEFWLWQNPNVAKALVSEAVESGIREWLRMQSTRLMDRFMEELESKFPHKKSTAPLNLIQDTGVTGECVVCPYCSGQNTHIRNMKGITNGISIVFDGECGHAWELTLQTRKGLCLAEVTETENKIFPTNELPLGPDEEFSI